MAEGLQYKIGADVTDFNKGIKQAEAGLNQLGATTSKALQTVSRNATNGAASLNSLGQVARDLPFGFIAIQNNLPIVIDQFSALSKQSGGVGGALKALGGALIGPAGIAFAFGAVIAGATALVQKYGSISAAVDALANSSNKQYKEQQALISLQKEASKNAGEEIARLEVLNAVSKDSTGSLENRKEAANEMLRVYKEYLPNLSQEAILNDQAADAINRAKDAILNKALAAAGESKLAEIGAKILENQLSLETAEKRLLTAKELNIKAAEKGAAESIKGIASVNTATVAYSTQLKKEADLVGNLKKQQKDLNEEFSRTRNITAGFAKLAGGSFITSKPAKTSGKDSGVGKVLEEVKKLKDSPTLATIDFTSFFTLDESALKDKVKLFADQTLTRFNEALKTAGKVNGKFTLIPSESVQAAIANVEGLKDAALGTVEAFSSFLAPAIDTVFNALGNGSSIIDALKQSFKAMIVGLGLAIAKAAILAGILSIINPAGAASAGLGKGFGAILGNLFKNFAGLPKFAEGGVVTGPTLGIFGEAGPEAVMPLDKLNSMLGNFGGGNVNVSGSFALSGNNLVAAITRTNKQQGRAF